MDILVVADSSDPIYPRMGAAQRALIGLPWPVDVLVCTPDEVEE